MEQLMVALIEIKRLGVPLGDAEEVCRVATELVWPYGKHVCVVLDLEGVPPHTAQALYKAYADTPVLGVRVNGSEWEAIRTNLHPQEKRFPLGKRFSLQGGEVFPKEAR